MGEAVYAGRMPAKKPADPNEKPQKQRFIETAREIGVDETGKEFERLFDRVAPPKKKPKEPPPNGA